MDHLLVYELWKNYCFFLNVITVAGYTLFHFIAWRHPLTSIQLIAVHANKLLNVIVKYEPPSKCKRRCQSDGQQYLYLFVCLLFYYVSVSMLCMSMSALCYCIYSFICFSQVSADDESVFDVHM